MAATRSQKRVAGERPENLNENPGNLQKVLAKISQKNKHKKVEPARKGRALEQEESSRQGRALEQTEETTFDIPELPFVDVQPLPVVERGPTKTSKEISGNVIAEELLEIPRLPVEPSFHNKAPLQSKERAKDVVQDVLKTTISITMEDLLSMSEPARQELRSFLTKRRSEKKSVTLSAEADSLEDASSEDVEIMRADRLPEATYEVLAQDTNGMAKGSVVVHDPVMQYLNALAPGEKPKTVVVAAESHALRTVYPLINGVSEVESLLDPGSQIVSMPREVATALQVPWDPGIMMHM